MKLAAFDEIYNFIVQTFSFEVILGLKKGCIVQISVFPLPPWPAYFC
jgi:hypothetical protein